MWEAGVNGKTLHFSLVGINNQNFLMQDRETKSWWQQVSGEAIHGPLKGKRLQLVDHDELTFTTWKSENKNSRVLRPVPAIVSAGKYVKSNWEERMANLPVVINPSGEGMTARTLIAGVMSGNSSKAYPFEILQKQKVILDSLGREPICVVLHSDGKSVRAFNREMNGMVLDLFRIEDDNFQMADSQTASRWNFAGRAVSGPLAGKQLQKIPILMDYWFDWKNYNPHTTIYNLK